MAKAQDTSERRILDLSALVVRDAVAISGKEYDVRNIDELGIIEIARVQEMAKRLAPLDKVADITAKQAETITATIEEMLGVIIIGLPADVARSISIAQFTQISDFWMTRANGDQPAGKDPTKPRTGARSSRGSNPSTAAARRAG